MLFPRRFLSRLNLDSFSTEMLLLQEIRVYMEGPKNVMWVLSRLVYCRQSKVVGQSKNVIWNRNCLHQNGEGGGPPATK